jgi:hypothetical protein
MRRVDARAPAPAFRALQQRQAGDRAGTRAAPGKGWTPKLPPTHSVLIRMGGFKKRDEQQSTQSISDFQSDINR